MIRIKETIVVEGKYDKNKLSSLVDGVIIETNGFGIFKDKKRLAMIRRLAEKNGLVILTDSDGAGFLIRGKLCSCIRPELIKNAYIPDILGKEKRKSTPSKEGKPVSYTHLIHQKQRPAAAFSNRRPAGRKLRGGELRHLYPFRRRLHRVPSALRCVRSRQW